jgi:hypothetical protein
MHWLQRHGWWALLAIAVLIALFGLGDLIVGFEWDPGIPLGLIGMTPPQVQAESPDAYRLIDFGVRSGGVNLIVIGVLLTAIVVFAYRQGRPWAWWTMWALPVWAGSAFFLNLAFGVAPGQSPPPPMVSGPILATLAAAILLVSAPRFLRRGGETTRPPS